MADRNTDMDNRDDISKVEPRVRWVYQLARKDLEHECARFRVDTAGGVRELRQRLITFLREGPDAMVSPQPHVVDIVRKWNLVFNGNTDPVMFLERLEELRISYKIKKAKLLTALPILFQDCALLWYRNNQDTWTDWDEFRDEFQAFYLPSKYGLRLEDEISKRKQRAGEQGRNYLIDLQTLIRRHGRLTQAQALFRLYTNLLPEYRLYIRRKDFTDIPSLLTRIEEYEQLQSELKPEPCRINILGLRKPDRECHPPDCTPNTRTVSYRDETLTCSRCGRQGILSRECACEPTSRDYRHRTAPVEATEPPQQGTSSAPPHANKNAAVIGTTVSLASLQVATNLTERPSMQILVNERPYTAIVDTGSAKSYVSRATADKLRAQNVPACSPKYMHVELANGLTCDLTREMRVPCKIGNVKHTVTFLCLPELTVEVLLGMDALRQCHAVIDVPNGRISCNNQFEKNTDIQTDTDIDPNIRTDPDTPRTPAPSWVKSPSSIPIPNRLRTELDQVTVVQTDPASESTSSTELTKVIIP